MYQIQEFSKEQSVLITGEGEVTGHTHRVAAFGEAVTEAISTKPGQLVKDLATSFLLKNAHSDSGIVAYNHEDHGMMPVFTDPLVAKGLIPKHGDAVVLVTIQQEMTESGFRQIVD